jgi:hypothetical protein
MNYLKALVIALVLASSAYAEPSTSTVSLPDAPTQVRHVPVFGVTDWTLAGSIAASRALDWTSTEECGRRPYVECHEANLPNALVHDKVGFALYETACTAGLVFAQYELTKLGHRRLARIGQAVDFALTAHTVVHNYHLDTTPGRPSNL